MQLTLRGRQVPSAILMLPWRGPWERTELRSAECLPESFRQRLDELKRHFNDWFDLTGPDLQGSSYPVPHYFLTEQGVLEIWAGVMKKLCDHPRLYRGYKKRDQQFPVILTLRKDLPRTLVSLPPFLSCSSFFPSFSFPHKEMLH